MQRDTLIGLGLTILLALLQWRVKDMPTAITTAGIVFSLGLIVWPYLPFPPRFNGPLFLALVGVSVVVGAVAWSVSLVQQPTFVIKQLTAQLFADPQSQDEKSYGAYWANSLSPNLLYGWFGDYNSVPPTEKAVSIFLTNVGPGDVRHLSIRWSLHSGPIPDLIRSSGFFKTRITALDQTHLEFTIARQGGTNSGAKFFALSGQNDIPIITAGTTQRALLPEMVNNALFLNALCTSKKISRNAVEFNARTHQMAPFEIRAMPTISLVVTYQNANNEIIEQEFEITGLISMSNVPPGGGYQLESEGAGARIFRLMVRQK